MTLSRFLRDFLYIPLGGNRGSRLFTYRNLMITMVLGGLWHGAAWTFVLWGALPRRRAGHRARRSAARFKTPGVAALADHVPSRRARLGPVPRAEHRAAPGTFLTRLGSLGAADAVDGAGAARDRRRDRPAAAAAERPLERAPGSARAAAARRCSAPRWPSSYCSSRRPCPARACRRSSTSASDATTPRSPQHRDDNLMERFDRAGLATLPRPRRGHRGRDRARSILVVCRGRLDPQGRASEMRPRHRPRRRARRRPPGRSWIAAACRSSTARTR